MSPFTISLKKPVIFIIMILLSGCATREDFRQSFIARYVKDGIYTNRIKGFRLDWPDKSNWIFRDYPEFDLSFDHVDGRSQIFVIGVNNLIRRDFPDGFHQWILDRLQARNVNQITHTDLTEGDVKRFRIITQCEFAIHRVQSLGIRRKTDAMLLQRGKHWVALIGICPVDDYQQKRTLFEQFFEKISMIP
ncbi:hypothetical protein JW823_00130 [bacterium]|nr:hypothetical protein [candidate division CSSED10-310 bacterium]